MSEVKEYRLTFAGAMLPTKDDADTLKIIADRLEELGETAFSAFIRDMAGKTTTAINTIGFLNREHRRLWDNDLFIEAMNKPYLPINPLEFPEK